MLRDMLSLAGWIMFILGVLLGSWVKSLVSSTASKVGG